MFETGLLNLTNWAGNVIMPTLAGLFFAAAIYCFSKAHPYSHLSWAGFASLMCSGLRQDALAVVHLGAARFQNAVQHGSGVGLSRHCDNFVC